MAPVELSETPPTSPSHSPPRKKAKFSLRLKGKSKGKKENDENVDFKEDKNQTTSNFYPIFRSPCQENGGASDMNVEPILPSYALAGLQNRDNVCYANAVLQVLRCCPGFERFVTALAQDIKILETTEDSNKHINIKPKYLINHLDKLLSQMSVYEAVFLEDKENCIYLRNKGANQLVLAAEPNDFMTAFRDLYPSFECNLQHDAQEFLCSLIMALQELANKINKLCNNNNNMSASTNKIATSTASNKSSFYPNLHMQHFVSNEGKSCQEKPASCNELSCQQESALNQIDSFKRDVFIKGLFQGKLVHQTKCLNCEQSKLRYEDIQEVSVPVVEDQPYLDARKKLMLSPTPKKDKVDVHTLHWAISQFASSECLQGNNKYFCENCNTYCEARISTCFEELPNVLTVHLKRFTSSIGLSSKITSNLETPLALSVQEWCSDKCQKQSNTYELFGIVLHSGISSGSGHYEAYVRVPHTKQLKQEDETIIKSDAFLCTNNEQAGDEKVLNVYDDNLSYNKEHQSVVEYSTDVDKATATFHVGKCDDGGTRDCNSDQGQTLDLACNSAVNNDKTAVNSGVSSVGLRGDIVTTTSNANYNERDCSDALQDFDSKDTSNSNSVHKANSDAEIISKSTNESITTTNEKEKTEGNFNVNQNRADKENEKGDSDESQRVPRRTLRPRKAKKSSSASRVEESIENPAEESKMQQESESFGYDDKSPLNAKGKSSCISLITKYFHRSKKQPSRTEKNELKRTIKCGHENTIGKEENAEIKKPSPKRVKTIVDSFKKISSNATSKSPTIRKLDFVSDATVKTSKVEQDSQEDDENLKVTNTMNFYPEQLTKDWIHFDDCTVDNIAKKDIIHVLSASESSYISPYLLFYKKTESS